MFMTSVILMVSFSLSTFNFFVAFCFFPSASLGDWSSLVVVRFVWCFDIILKTCGSGEQKKLKIQKNGDDITSSFPFVRSIFSRTHTYTHTLDTRWCILLCLLLLFSRWRIPRRFRRLRSRRRGESKQPLKSGRKTQRRHLRRRGVIQRRRAPERVPLKWVVAVWKEHPIFD